MRKVQLFVAVASSVVGVLVVACGSTTSNNPPGGSADAGGDSAQTTSSSSSGGGSDGGDAGVTSSDDAAVACVIGDADISTLSPVDASLDDAGASVGTCIACAKSSCASDVTACNGDCSCNNALVCIFDCLGGAGNTLLTCAEQCGGVASLDATEKALLECAVGGCSAECGTAGLLGGGGGGGGNKDAAVDDDASATDGGSVDAGGDAADAN